jgi:Tfp pilus assembly protein PilP
MRSALDIKNHRARQLSAMFLAVLLVTGAGWLSGCDDAPAPSSSRRSRMKRKKKAPRPAQKVVAPAPVIPERELTDKDFIEGIDNRDPFRTFLAQLRPTIKKSTGRQIPIIMPRYGLDELKLIAVVTGPKVRPTAMFRTPKGLGVTVRRGQRISKNAAKVKRILPDKVVVEIDKKHEDTKTKADRIIELHPKEARKEIFESADRGLKEGETEDESSPAADEPDTGASAESEEEEEKEQ